jgi:hypothetical protein
MERKYGRYAISNLMYYIVIINIVGAVIGYINSDIYLYFLSLDFERIFHGQVWRLVTFILEPSVSSVSDIFFFAISMYLYYMIGNALERTWGAFRFNMYYFSGIILTILGSLLVFLVTGRSISPGLDYVYQAMFLAFAALYPDMELMLFFVLPIKVKWLGIIYGAILIFEVITLLSAGGYVYAFFIVIAMGNFLLFFFLSRNYNRISPKEIKRKQHFKKETEKPGGVRHRCAICGRTEKDSPDMEFRFCSRCDGDYEYCMDHIFSHQHIHREKNPNSNVMEFHKK